MQNNHVSFLEINASALTYNLNFFKEKLNKTTKILLVVKAFGYGSYAQKVAKFLENKVDYFAVAYTPEGINLRKAGIKKPILVLHPQVSNFKDIIKYNLEPNLYSFYILNHFIKHIKENKINNYPIHLKFNTGLNRLGFIKNNIEELLSILKNSNVKVNSIFSHIAASEDLNEKEFTLNQIKAFKEIAIQVEKHFSYPILKHMLNTSGVINYAQQAQFDMVRIGIGLYGFGNEEKYTSKLKNALTLKSVISQIQTISKGESVGYNRAFFTKEKLKYATIPIGHADGISRKLGNKKGYIYINYQKAPIIGNVCMDMIMVDITHINCKEGDEVIIYKNQQHIEDLANAQNTISYEILTAISQRIKRVFKKI